MHLRLIYPAVSGHDRDISFRFPDAPSDRPYVITNTVSTVDGATSVRGRAGGIGSPVDRRMMRLLRSSADALMVGAGTLRAERVNPHLDADLADARLAYGRPAHPLAVTISASLNLNPNHRFFVNGPDRTVVFTTIAGVAEAGTELERVATLSIVGQEQVDLRDALAQLRQRWGVQTLVCEGGPTLNQQLLDLGVLDEVFWTIAPKLAGGRGPDRVAGADAEERIRALLDLLSLFEQDGELFARYRVRREAST